MAFNRDEVEKLLVECQRCCCVCHRFCCTKIETDHIVPENDGGTDDISNAIPVCFDCHAEIHTYNPQHPRGRRFTQNELRLHRDAWLKACKEPSKARAAFPNERAPVGPLQALIDELELNRTIASKIELEDFGCCFSNVQFQRAINDGAVSLLKPELKTKILEAYVAMGAANEVIASYFKAAIGRSVSASGATHPIKRVEKCRPLIDSALDALLSFLGHSS